MGPAACCKRLGTHPHRCPPRAPQGKKFVALPTLAAAEGLAWRQAFSAKLGRHAVADSDLPAGTLILVEKPVVTVPRSK